ncbi:MAG TPA: type II toxin-antitoxin system PemK/MazF family toxin [bacterium]
MVTASDIARGTRPIVIRRFDVVLVNLDPVVGHEIRKTRPCLVVSPDEMNRTIDTFIVAPMTTRGRAYPTRVSCTFHGKSGQIVLDQIRTIDRARIAGRLGRIAEETQRTVLAAVQEMFAE